ncbi:rab11 family-interacting protein 4-like isoform X2 [Ctenocephalides felis]|uniref:rab11 family-interacting protein 4-like isoform X2 n=1 Tax=Ctenocephalides felis TaxID=7515 RepID=UPI000E6E2721|nr:rab11 family-interacting protein 4-like isoform X2 [Ctenocephalides felis]
MGDITSEDGACSSIADEERARRLFELCDGDGDGYIDSEDLESVCRTLGLVEPLKPLLMGLGADERGRISLKDFAARRHALKPQIGAICQKGNSSVGKQDSWGWDSGLGTRELSPERVREYTSASTTMLDIENKVG